MESRVKDDRKGVCYKCGLHCHTDVHHIFEGARRHKSDELRLTVNLCRDCHRFVHDYKGKDFRDFLHKLGQTIYEEEIGSRDEFISDFIKSFL